MAKAKTITTEVWNDLRTELKIHAQEAAGQLSQAYCVLELLISDGERSDGFSMKHGNVVDTLKAVKNLMEQAEASNHSVMHNIEHGATEFG